MLQSTKTTVTSILGGKDEIDSSFNECIACGQCL